MARNDIKFAQGHQADFGQANQMFLQAQQQYNNAIKNAQDTVTAFDKAVTARTTAKAKEMIDALSLQEWQDNARREQLQQDLTDYANSVGNMIDAKAVQEYSQGNLKRLYDNENAGLEHQVNQNTLTKDNILTEQKQDQQETDNILSKAILLDNALKKYSPDTPEYQTIQQQITDLTQGTTDKVKLSVLDGLEARQLSDIEKETKLNIANDKLGDSQILEAVSMLPYLNDNIAKAQRIRQYWSSMPEGTQGREEVIKQATQDETTYTNLLNRTVSSVPPHLRGKILSNASTGLNEAIATTSKEYGTAHQQRTLAENARQFDVATKQRRLEQAFKQAIEKGQLQNQTATTQANIASKQIEDAIKLDEHTNPKPKANSKSEANSSKDGKVDLVASSTNDKGELIIPNLRNNIHHTINTIKNSTQDLDNASYQKFLREDYPKIESQHSGLTEFVNGFNGSRKELEDSVDNYRKPNKQPLTNSEKQYVLTKIASGSIGYFPYRRDAQIKDALHAYEVDSNTVKLNKIQETLTNVVAGLASKNHGQKEIADILKQTVPPEYYKSLPEPYRQLLTASKVSEVIENKSVSTTPNVSNTSSKPTNNTFIPNKMYLLSR